MVEEEDGDWSRISGVDVKQQCASYGFFGMAIWG